MTAYTPHWEREGVSAFLAAYDRALADITARHEQHKADIKRTSDRLDRVAQLLGDRP